MSIEKAKKYFLGAPSHERLNCAQAVLKAFQEKFSVTDELISQCKAYGAGKAPGGCCGAFHAAKSILEKHSPEKCKDLENKFIADAGSTKCGDIRAMRKLSCLGCIEKTAAMLEDV